jgi:NTP pyrophosphatase (non-canonical NTP hydrolase)
MSIEGLQEKVIEWANQRDLYRLSTDLTRFDKMAEEFEELVDELFRPDNGRVDFDKVAMEAGDVIVTLINLLHPLGLDLETCLDAAYQKIKNRKGKMVGGTFVKDGGNPKTKKETE